MIKIQDLNSKNFAAFGQVIEMNGSSDFEFNEGRAQRWHDLVDMDVDEAGEMGVSLCRSNRVSNPYDLIYLERHPLASQAFIPLDDKPFAIIVAPDHENKPGDLCVFLTNGKQGINYARNCWHGTLAPLGGVQNFVIIDRVRGGGENLELFHFDEPITLHFPL